jgi:Flp pilus assembly protein TadG
MTMMTKSLLSRVIRRRRQRGAAIVEAALVMPVMAVFLGLIAFTHHSYAAKIDKQAATRSGTLFYASHACTGDMPADVTKMAVDNDVGADSKADADSAKLGGSNSPGATSAVSRDGNWAKSTPPATNVTGLAASDHGLITLNRKISAGSEVACNEPVFTSKWTAVFQEIGSMYSSHAGF